MAFYIKIRKVSEDSEIAVYEFWDYEEKKGEFEIDKRLGEVRLRRSIEGDEKGRLFVRAAAKIIKAWKKGALPEVTQWAS